MMAANQTIGIGGNETAAELENVEVRFPPTAIFFCADLRWDVSYDHGDESLLELLVEMIT